MTERPTTSGSRSRISRSTVRAPTRCTRMRSATDDLMMPADVAGQRRQRAVRHAHRQRRRVLERVRHREQKNPHGSLGAARIPRMTALCAGDGNCNGPAATGTGNQAVAGRLAGTRNCDHPVVISRSVSRFILICVPLAICAARLHSQGAGSPTVVTQDVNRCLTVVRLAASRRGNAGRGRQADPPPRESDERPPRRPIRRRASATSPPESPPA